MMHFSTRRKCDVDDSNLSDVRTGRALWGSGHNKHVATLLCTVHLAAQARAQNTCGILIRLVANVLVLLVLLRLLVVTWDFFGGLATL